VLYIPERLITQRNDSTFVTVRNGARQTEERWIKTGLSDAINVEVLEGLRVTDSIVEPPPREIT
jgi:HlyD family secretion protein